MTSVAKQPRRALAPDMGDTSSWPRVDVEALEEPARERFLRVQAAIEGYLQHGDLRQHCKSAGIDCKDLIRQLHRCLSVDEDGEIQGWRALIKGRQTVPVKRFKALPAGGTGLVTGFRGAFLEFLEIHPHIRERLDTLILKGKNVSTIHEAHISAKSLHKTFVRLCEAEGLTREDYPLNSRSCGRRSIERYIQSVIHTHLSQGTLVRYGKDAAKRLSVGKQMAPHALSFAPFDLVGADPHKLHCFGSVRIPGPAGVQRVAIERLWIIPILENECRVILGYSVGIRTECSAATLEEALISSTTQWQPRKLLAGMSYKPGAGFPSGIFPELIGCSWCTLSVDNAAIHFAKAIAERARRRLGCAVTWGAVGHWEHRPVLERLMLTLEKYGFQRMPSSTGSSPKDPRRDDPVRKAVNIGIDWEVLLDLIDVVLADYNATPSEALGNRTPLNVMRDHLHASHSTFLPRTLPPASPFHPDLGTTVEIRIIRGDETLGRRPYVEIDGARYTNHILASTMALVGKKLRVHIKGDFRYVEAYFETGEQLGTLTVKGPWSRSAHTREMRKQVNALRNAGELAFGADDDPIEALMRYYASKAHQQAEKRPMKVSKDATKLVNAARESQRPIPEVAMTRPKSEDAVAPLPSKPLTDMKKSVKWKTIVR